ncbi:MAG: hypothetical protein OXG64_04020 [Chloroflexi bacterium]|nr:hypothetical protein [Chloroflexota bacterium]
MALKRTWVRRRHDPAHTGLWRREAAQTLEARGGHGGSAGAAQSRGQVSVRGDDGTAAVVDHLDLTGHGLR